MENIDPKKTPGSPQEAGQRMWEDSWRPEDKAMESAEDEELNVETVEDMERTKTPRRRRAREGAGESARSPALSALSVSEFFR